MIYIPVCECANCWNYMYLYDVKFMVAEIIIPGYDFIIFT